MSYSSNILLLLDTAISTGLLWKNNFIVFSKKYDQNVAEQLDLMQAITMVLKQSPVVKGVHWPSGIHWTQSTKN